MPITRTYYKVHRVFPDPDYFYMENISGSAANFNVNKTGTPASTDLSYSLDKVTWTDIHNGGTISNVANNAKVYFRSTTGLNKDNSNYFWFNSDDSFNAGGHIATLFNYTNVNSTTAIPNMGCYRLFYNSQIIHANIDFYGLKTIGINGCEEMFSRSRSLISVPDFSSLENIGDYGLMGMFNFCTSLYTPVDLSNVTTVGYWGCRITYASCSSLNEAIAPNISNWNTGNFSSWLSGAASTGVVRKPAGLTITADSESGVPTGWTTEDY